MLTALKGVPTQARYVDDVERAALRVMSKYLPGGKKVDTDVLEKVIRAGAPSRFHSIFSPSEIATMTSESPATMATKLPSRVNILTQIPDT